MVMEKKAEPVQKRTPRIDRKTNDVKLAEERTTNWSSEAILILFSSPVNSDLTMLFGLSQGKTAIAPKRTA